MKRILLFSIFLFSSSAFSLYEYDYCKEIYGAAAEFRGPGYSPDVDEIIEISELLALTYAYKNNAEHPEELAAEAAEAVHLSILKSSLEGLGLVTGGNRPQTIFVSKCIQALRDKFK